MFVILLIELSLSPSLDSTIKLIKLKYNNVFLTKFISINILDSS